MNRFGSHCGLRSNWPSVCCGLLANQFARLLARWVLGAGLESACPFTRVFRSCGVRYL